MLEASRHGIGIDAAGANSHGLRRIRSLFSVANHSGFFALWCATLLAGADDGEHRQQGRRQDKGQDRTGRGRRIFAGRGPARGRGVSVRHQG